MDGRGDKIDQGTLLRFLGEMVWFPSAALRPYLAWEAIDARSARVTMTYQGVSAKFAGPPRPARRAVDALCYGGVSSGPTIPDPPTTPVVPSRIGSYRVVGPIGRGGMGMVVEAVHEQIGRRAAIKLLHPVLAREPEFARRFLNEARSVNLVRHPGLVEVIDFGETADHVPYLVMEFLEGQTLSARLRARGGALPEQEVMNLARQMAPAMLAAHQKGIVHRDLKPDNVMLVPDPLAPGGERVKILDFGIAKLQPEATTLALEDTRPGIMMGTPRYMAPEQMASAGAVDARADVFSLGVMLYEMLAGRLPFQGLGSLVSTAQPLARAAPLVSPPVAALIDRMLTRDAAMRPSMEAVAGTIARLTAPAPRRSAGLLVAGLLGALFGGLLLVYFYQSRVAALARDLGALRQLALSGLRADLQEGAAELRRGALQALARGRDAEQRPLIEPLLSDDEVLVQGQAAEALGRLGDARAAPALRALSNRAQRASVRVAAAAALLRLGDEGGQALLRQILEESSRDAELGGPRLEAALLLCDQGLQQAQRQLRAWLQGEVFSDKVQVTILAHLAQAGDEPAYQELRRRLAAPGGGPMQVGVAGHLARLGEPEALRWLRRALEEPGAAGARLMAARLLSGLQEGAEAEPALRVLREVIADGKAEVAARVLAAEGLGDAGGSEDAVRLGPLLRGRGVPPRLRQSAAGSVLRIAQSDPSALAEQGLAWAQATLADGSWLAREQAVGLLATLGPEVAAPLLRRVLKDDPDARVRGRAALALARLDGRVERPVAALVAAAQREGSTVAGVRLLGQLVEQGAERDARAELARWPTVEQGPVLWRAVHHPEVVVRVAAAEVSALLPGRRGVPLLRFLLDDPSPAVRGRAASLLRRLPAAAEAPVASPPVVTPGSPAPPSVDLGTAAAPVAPVQVPAAPAAADAVEAGLREGVEAARRGDLTRATKLLERLNGRCDREGGVGCARIAGKLAYELGRVYEARGLWTEAMNEYQRARQRGHRGADEAAGRLSARLGRVRISYEVKGRCHREDLWAPPGEHRVRSGGRSSPVTVRAGETVELPGCGAGARP